MAATSLSEQLFYPGFLEDIILDRVNKVLYENTKQVEERKDVEIEAREVRCAVLEENLVKANNKIKYLETFQVQAMNKIASLESTQLQVAQYNTEVLDLFGQLHQRFPRMYPSAPASATSMIAPDSSFSFVHVRAPRAATPKDTIESAPEPNSEPARTIESESKFAPIVSKKMKKRERERTKKDEEKRKKSEAAVPGKLEGNEFQAADNAAAAMAAEDTAAEQAVGEEVNRKVDEGAGAIVKREKEKKAEDACCYCHLLDL
ncbi:hypothetical protein DL96DRAFT_668802 [Flagelloscypha sp. PMI_526]|nr:hypothetical protein DL96DRAFT_668802 [Flagelloscypha sp. PMI_526]